MSENRRGHPYQLAIEKRESFHATISPTKWKDFSRVFYLILLSGFFALLVFWYGEMPVSGLLLVGAFLLTCLTIVFLQYKRVWQIIQVDGDELVITTQSVLGEARKRAFRFRDIEAVVHEPRFVAIYIKVRGMRWIRGLANYGLPTVEKKLLAEELAGYLGVPLMRKGIWSTRFYPQELGKHQKEE